MDPMKLKQLEELLDVQNRLKQAGQAEQDFAAQEKQAGQDFARDKAIVRSLDQYSAARRNPYEGVFSGARSSPAGKGYEELLEKRQVQSPQERTAQILDEYRKAKLGQWTADQELSGKKELEQMKIDADLRKAQLAQAQKPEKGTKAQEAVDAAFAKDYNDFVVQGGAADAAKGLAQLESAKEMLKNDPSITGRSGYIPNILGLREALVPESKSVQEAVEEVVQRNLRTILGAQFTEKEGERLISRAYNPKLSAEENIARIDRLQKQMELAMQAKMDAAKYYEENGTMQGFKGQTNFRSIIDQFDDKAVAKKDTPSSNPLIKDANASNPIWNKDKEKRLEELRRKQAEGTLK